jgi:carnitine 3-dehydrogenase
VFFRYIGMHALHVRKEVPGHLTDRLQEAIWREILHMINDGVATTGELDDSIIYGPGLRWAAMGTNMIYHLAGGESGMRHMLAQFGPCLKWPWTRLEAPELSETLIDRMVEGTRAQAAGRSIRELERLRDDYLVAIQQVLRQYNIGAGATLKALEERLYRDAAGAAGEPGPDAGTTLHYRASVLPDWVDYNGHMSDFRYSQLFGDATDALYRKVGIDAAYREAGHMFYTVETHVRHVGEAKAGDPLVVDTRILSVDEKRLHLFHRLQRGPGGRTLATGEQMQLHVDIRAARAAPVDAGVRARLEELCAAHALLPRPAEAGRHIGQARA